MNTEILYIGVDVDDKAFHAHCISKATGEQNSFSCKPTLSALLDQLQKRSANKEDFRICYEAGYLGFTLCRDLLAQGFNCVVVAPSLIPTLHNKQIKTDRLDSKNLAFMLSKGLLT